MNLVTVSLKGGLGNQLFQIAAAFAYSLRYDKQLVLDFDLCDTPYQGAPAKAYLDNIFSKIATFATPPPLADTTFIAYKEPHYSFSEIPYFPGNVKLEGYFQSERYFEEFKGEIKGLILLPPEAIAKADSFLSKLPDRPYTAIHVRRGDFLKFSKVHEVCDLKYYKAAMKKVGDSSFVVISDDIEWCRKNFDTRHVWFSSFENEVEDFTLMTACQHKIISNSSFSWWASYVSEENGVVVAPGKWFGPKGPKDQQDVVPKEWIRIRSWLSF